MITSKEPPKDEAPLQQKLSPDSTELKSPQSDQSGNSLVVPEKPSEDGYHWRKYGQKNVKGNEFIRSYYRCSSPNCHVKKQIERTHDGRITDTTYFGEHDHPKAYPIFHVAALSSPSTQMETPEQSSAIVEDKPSNAHASTSEKVPKGFHGHKHTVVPESAESIPVTNVLSSVAKYHSNHDENRALKRRKKVVDTAEAMLDKPSSESRLVIETVSAVDIVNDGYRWRKYGQKLVRGNPNPRSYYRCSNPGCPAKKQVERASHDSRVVITAYEGQHDHDIPPTRTILPHFTATTLAELTDGAKSKAEEGIGAHDTHFSPEPTSGVRHKKEGKINCDKASNLSDPRNSAKPKPVEEIKAVNTPTLSETTHGSVPETEGEINHHEKSKLSDGVKTEPQERNCASTLSEPTSSVRPKTKFLSEPTNGAKPKLEEGVIAHIVPTLSEPASGAMPETEGESVQLKTPSSSESIKCVKPEQDEQISSLNRPTSSVATQGDKTQTGGEISCCSLPNISNPMIGANHSAVEETNPHEARDTSDLANGANEKTKELYSEIRSTLSGPAIEIKTEQEDTQCQDSANIPEQTETEDSEEKGGAPGDTETKKSEQQAPVTKQEELPSSGSVAISSCPETKSNDNGHKPGAHPASC